MDDFTGYTDGNKWSWQLAFQICKAVTFTQKRVGEANDNLQHPDFGVCECSHDMAI